MRGHEFLFVESKNETKTKKIKECTQKIKNRGGARRHKKIILSLAKFQSILPYKPAALAGPVKPALAGRSAQPESAAPSPAGAGCRTGS